MSRPKHLTRDFYRPISQSSDLCVCEGRKRDKTLESHSVSLQLTGTARCAPDRDPDKI